MMEKKMIGHKIRMIHNSIDKYFDMHKPAEADRIPIGQGMMIRYLVDHRDEDVFQKDLEAFFGISGATASNMLKGLEKHNMIKRIPVEHDARLKKICLLPKAIEHEERIRNNIRVLENCMAKNFSQEEITTFCNMLDKVLLNLEELQGEITTKKHHK